MPKMSFKKWGNSAATRWPNTLLEAANLKIDDIVDVTYVQVNDNGQIILTLTPVKPTVKKVKYSLAEMISRVTPENSHEAVDFGKPIGNEA